MTELSIIIVNYKTLAVTTDCIAAVFKSKTDSKFEVILVDNDSGDGSVEALRKKFPRIKIIARKNNGGFAVANNRGVAAATGKYVWLLNSDTLIFPDTIEKLLDEAKKSDAPIASCRLLNRDLTVQPQGGALPTLVNLSLWMLNLDGFAAKLLKIRSYQNRNMNSFSQNQTGGWLGGTALLIRRDVYQALNGLDEKIFMYGEDVEFCLRAYRHGLSINYFAKPKLVHLGQVSSGKERPVLGEFRGLKYIYLKHSSLPAYIYVRFILKIGALLRFIMYTMQGNKERRTTYAKAFFLA